MRPRPSFNLSVRPTLPIGVDLRPPTTFSARIATALRSSTGPEYTPVSVAEVDRWTFVGEKADNPHDRKGGGLVVLIPQLREETLYF